MDAFPTYLNLLNFEIDAVNPAEGPKRLDMSVEAVEAMTGKRGPFVLCMDEPSAEKLLMSLALHLGVTVVR